MPVAYSPYTGSLGNISLGVCYVNIGSDLGDFNDVSLSVDVTTKVIGGGYPKVPQAVVIENMKASGSVSLSELNGPVVPLVNKALSIAAGLSTMESTTVNIGVYRPLSGVSEIQFNGLLLPQFELNFTNGESNSVKLFFEAIAEESDINLGTVISGGGAGGGGGVFVPCPTWMLNPMSIGVGMPKVTSPLFSGQVTNASVRLNTEFKRMEFGFPKLCRALIPMSSTLEIEFTTEEFINATVDTDSEGPVSVSALLVGGSYATFSAPNCRCTGGGPNMSKGDWSGTTYKWTVIPQIGGSYGTYG